MFDELGRIQANLKYYLEGTDENHEELSRYSRCPSHDSRPTLPEKIILELSSVALTCSLELSLCLIQQRAIKTYGEVQISPSIFNLYTR
jgi:hypothetical protein